MRHVSRSIVIRLHGKVGERAQLKLMRIWRKTLLSCAHEALRLYFLPIEEANFFQPSLCLRCVSKSNKAASFYLSQSC